VLIDILLKFQVRLHQLTPNAFAHFSKYFWVVMSFYRKPSSDGFAKRHELHYQPKKVDVDRSEKSQQFGCINFHARLGSGAKLTPAIKIKWLSGWTKAWFYCKVPHTCVHRGELCIIYNHKCAAWTSGWSPLLTTLTITQGTSPLSKPPNLSGSGCSGRVCGLQHAPTGC
jgi:hypothetical protein